MFEWRVPSEPLSSFVGLLWVQEGRHAATRRERLVPDGGMELVIDLRADTIPLFDHLSGERCGRANGSVFCGAHSQSFLIERGTEECVMGAHFRPGGGLPFFRVPIGELTNAMVSLDDLWKERAVELRERLSGAPSHSHRFDILEAFLLARAVRPLEHHPSVAYALKQWETSPTLAVRDVVAGSGFGERRFTQLFRDEVGLSPKLFCRVRRFARVLSHLAKVQAQDVVWLDVALEHGFFDQAHFIHEMRAFSGLTPTEYLTQSGQTPDLVGLPS